MLDENGLHGTQNDRYELVNKLKEDLIDDNITFSSKFNLETQNGFKTLPIMNRLPKMHKTSTGTSFIVASKRCSTKTLSKGVTNTLKLTFN